MKTSLHFYRFPFSTVILCFSLVIMTVISTEMAYAQCPSPKSTGCSSNNLAFPLGQRVYVDIDFRLTQAQQSQIRAGLDSWNDANVRNGSGVVFDYGGVPTEPGSVNVLHITSGTLTNNDGSVNTTTVAQINYNRLNDAAGEAYDATITFNTGGATASDDPNSPFYNQPYYNQNASGYNTVFTKKTMHEVGHGMGLCDVPVAQQQAGQSVMNTSRDDCPNDNCGIQPLTVQDCDENAVSDVPNYQPLPTPTPTNTGGGGMSYCEMYPSSCYGGGYGGGYGGYGGGCYDVYEKDYSYVCVEGHGCSVTEFYDYLYTYCTY
jgi:hypothetical protein